MKKQFLVLKFILIIGVGLQAQGFGVSMSYLFPYKGYFASPVAPLAFTLPLSFGDYFGFKIPLTLYNVGGMQISGLPFGNSEKPLMGPFLSLTMGFCPMIKIPLSKDKFILEINGGWLGFQNIKPKIMNGNMNELIALSEGLSNVSSEWEFKNKFGSGLMYGGGLLYFINKKIGLKLGAQYHDAKGKLEFKGDYSGYDLSGDKVGKDSDYNDARLDYRGLSVSVGVVIKN